MVRSEVLKKLLVNLYNVVFSDSPTAFGSSPTAFGKTKFATFFETFRLPNFFCELQK